MECNEVFISNDILLVEGESISVDLIYTLVALKKLHKITPTEFSHLQVALYQKMGYLTTKRTAHYSAQAILLQHMHKHPYVIFQGIMEYHAYSFA